MPYVVDCTAIACDCKKGSSGGVKCDMFTGDVRSIGAMVVAKNRSAIVHSLCFLVCNQYLNDLSILTILLHF